MHIAGLSHILLPESALCPDDENKFKFADTAIETLVKSMEKHGCSRFRITAKIAGGACMFASTGINIGQRNVEVVKRELCRLNINLTGEDTGGNFGRTVDINPENGTVTVKAIGKANREL
ncbi:Chemoreceptor glutamine deamidase CheD [bioreactor metagenome]|uniref:Chemoreceptor glutamine deamidase CheD n=1 Tax=bioreactor metagenome TaxID=1076179 RepID=A0A645GVI5_9ZZZZ